MKSRYIASKTEQERIAMQVAREEIERQKAELCPKCEEGIANQVAAVMLKVLHDEYGFGKKRMQDVVNKTESLFRLCMIDGKKYSSMQAVDWLRDAMGIDLERDTK